MKLDMAYFLGMVCGNGEIIRGQQTTQINIDIPHKKNKTESDQDVKIYVKASTADIRNVIEPLIDTTIVPTQNDHSTILSLTKNNGDYLIRETLRYIGYATSHNNIEIDRDIFDFEYDEKLSFLKGFADVTGYIRRSNYYFQKHKHRVFIEIPRNWHLVIDICNLLKDVNIPVQNIDWAHPNIRDPNLKGYNKGNKNFWKKEHQIKIFANEFLPIGFSVIHKNEALKELANELIEGEKENGKDASELTHRFYWEMQNKHNHKKFHPGEDDEFITTEIRGKHFNSWKEIAEALGYHE